MQTISIFHYLILAVIIFSIGLLGTFLTKNVIKILISIEIMLTGVNLNFMTFATFCDGINFDGYIFTLFYTAIGAVEIAVALYIFYIMYKFKKSDNIDKYGDL